MSKKTALRGVYCDKLQKEEEEKPADYYDDHQNPSLIIAHDTAQAQYLAQILRNISKF